jgi:uncharacterized protein YegP (UPF0339 family)
VAPKAERQLYDSGNADRVRVFKGQEGEWHWHRQAPNNEIVSTSGEGFHNKADAISSVLRNNAGAQEDPNNDLLFYVPQATPQA